MVSGGVLVEGREIRLGALTFIADDSAWLQEAPLDIDAFPSAGRRTSVRASAASSCGNRRPSIGRPLCRPPSLFPALLSLCKKIRAVANLTKK